MCIHEIIIFLEKHMVLSVVWILLLIIMTYIIINGWLVQSSEIFCNRAIFLINKKNAIIVDIRYKDDYSSGYIINSINISPKRIRENDIYELKKFKNSPLIIIHNNNITAHSIKRHLFKLGFERVYVLYGGINSWKSNNLPLLLKK